MKLGEVGIIINLGTFFDLSAFTLLEFKITPPNGGAPITLTSTTGRVSAPSVQSGGFPTDTYMQIATEASDFSVVGVHTICGVYTNTVIPQVFHTDDATLTIEEGC